MMASESKGLEIPEQHGDQQKTRRPSTVRHRNSNAKPLSTQSKEPEFLAGDLSLADNGLVSCFGDLEGVTMMRDMDWR